MNGRPALLWVAHQAPLPATDGGRQRSLALLHSLAGRFDVTVAVLHAWAPPDPRTAGEYLPGVTWLDLSGGRVAQLAAAPLLVAARRPPVLRHFSQPRQRRALRSLLISRRFSAVVADTPYATGALPPRDPRVPSQTTLIVNTHNVEREVWQAAAPSVSGGRLRLALDRHLVGNWELRALDQADAVAFCAQRDLDVLAPRLRPGLTCRVVPNAVDTERLRPLAPPQQATEALFVGGLDYAPNAEAARFIAGRLAPLLAAGGLTAVIVGGDGPGVAGDGGDGAAGVRFAGRPDDLAPLYERAFAAVVPIFSGSGTRLKVLEALAYGRPLVASAKAVEGLAMTPEAHYLPAEDEAAFAAQLGRLAGDPALRDELARRGRDLVEAQYSWASAGAAFLSLLADCGVPVADTASRREA
jgi:polysaccharide biosynthesis protein PslH